MNWQWLIDQGLIQGNAAYYSEGRATAAEYNNAITTAYKNSSGAQRQQFVDMMWATGAFEGDPSYWYGDRTSEAASLGTAAESLAPSMGTAQEGMDVPRFGIAGGAQLWKNTDTGQSYIIYQVPDTDGDPIYMRWTVPSEADVQSFFGPGQPVIYQRTVTNASDDWLNAVDFGSSTDIANVAENPFDGWSSTLSIESKSQPWILDDDYQTLLAMSVVENRMLTEAEIASTSWYSTHSEGERQWMLIQHSDPMTAQNNIDDGRISVRNLLQQSGVTDPDDQLVDFMADKLTMGQWTKQKLDQQILIMSDPYYKDEPLDTEFRNFISDNDISYTHTSDMENEVRSQVQRWLGTNFGNWSNEQVSEWAGKLRNDPNSAEALVDTLKTQREALFPGYDREADYETIASPWKTMMRNVWGEVPNDSDQTLQNIIRLNDAGEAGKLLTSEGLKRGNDNVVNSVQSALINSFGGV